MFSERFIQVDPEDYVFDVSEGQDRSMCILLIVASDMPIHVIGMPLFINYYSVHNLEEATIDWVPIPNSPKPALKSGVLPVQFLAAAGAARGTSPYTYIIEGIFVAVAIVVFIWVVWPWIQTLTSEVYLQYTYAAIYFVVIAALAIWAIPLLDPLLPEGWSGAPVVNENVRKVKQGNSNSFAIFGVICVFFAFILTRKAAKKSAPQI